MAAHGIRTLFPVSRYRVRIPWAAITAAAPSGSDSAVWSYTSTHIPGPRYTEMSAPAPAVRTVAGWGTRGGAWGRPRPDAPTASTRRITVATGRRRRVIWLRYRVGGHLARGPGRIRGGHSRNPEPPNPALWPDSWGISKGTGRSGFGPGGAG